MARKVFFSFHYKRDSHRVAQIRNCDSVSKHFERSPFLDWAQWESIKKNGDQAIRNWIDNNMNGAGVVVLCYGYETHTRRWVKYELEKAHIEGKGILAINMSGMKTMQGQIDPAGTNPLSVAKDSQGTPLIFYNKYITYHWVNEDGRNYIDE